MAQAAAKPTPADRAAAAAWIDGPFAATRDPDWIARNREHLIDLAADAEMQRRILASSRARSAAEVRAA